MFINVLIDQLQIERIALAESNPQARQFLQLQDIKFIKIYDQDGVSYRKNNVTLQELIDSSSVNRRSRLGVNLEEEKMYCICKRDTFTFCRYYQELVKKKEAQMKELCVKKDDANKRLRELDGVLSRKTV